MTTIIPPAKVYYAKFGPIFGGYLAPYLDQNMGAGLGYQHPNSEAGVINLNTGNKFEVKKHSDIVDHYLHLVNKLRDESAHMDGKEIERMIPNYHVIKDGSLYGVVTL